MTQKSSKLHFQQCWTFPHDVEKRINTFLQDRKNEIWLHAPSGISQIGKGRFSKITVLTVDHDEKTKPDILCNIFELSENPTIRQIIETRGGVDGIISDPIWIKDETCKHCKKKTKIEKGLAYPQRRHLSFSFRDILKPDGILIMNCPWNPKVKGLTIFRYPEIPMQNYNSFRNLPYLWYLKKINFSIEHQSTLI